jgi:hypothetical protein
MSNSLVSLDAIPALLVRERQALELLSNPVEALDAERRLAAIAELTKRAGLAVPVQNEATFLRAEALERLSVLVDLGQAAGDIATKGDRKSPGFGDLGIPQQRVSEGRAIARTGALDAIRAEAEKHPDKPVSMDAILKQAKRSERESSAREATAEREQAARLEIALSEEDPYELHHASVSDWRPVGISSIITDPPYIGDAIPLYEMLRDFAVDVLPDGGALVVMTWQAILPEVIDALRHDELAYRWTICWRYANNENTVDHARKVFDCWKPVLVYHKGSMPSDAQTMRDEIANESADKNFHEWGQSVAGFERLVKTFSLPGDIVCDPFLGAGTTAVAALANARRFVGCDTDEVAIGTTLRRLASFPLD